MARLVAALAGVILIAPGQAAVPGRNGLLMVLRDKEPPTPPCTLGRCPAVAPSAQREIAYLAPTGRLVERRPLPAATTVAASPDGTSIAYDQGDGIWIGDVDLRSAHRIVGFGFWPAWSPDGRRLAFTNGGQIWVVDRTGRHLRRLATTRRFLTSIAWSPDGGTIAFVSSRSVKPGDPLLRSCATRGAVKAIPASGGHARILYKPAIRCPDVGSFDWAQDGRHFVVTVVNGAQQDTPPDPRADRTVGVNVVSADGHHARRIARRGWTAIRSPDGRRIATSDAMGRCPASRPEPDGTVCIRTLRPDGSHARAIAVLDNDTNANFPLTWAAAEMSRRRP